MVKENNHSFFPPPGGIKKKEIYSSGYINLRDFLEQFEPFINHTSVDKTVENLIIMVRNRNQQYSLLQLEQKKPTKISANSPSLGRMKNLQNERVEKIP